VEVLHRSSCMAARDSPKGCILQRLEWVNRMLEERSCRKPDGSCVAQERRDQSFVHEDSILLGETPVPSHYCLDNVEPLTCLGALMLNMGCESVVYVKKDPQDLHAILNRDLDALIEDLWVSLFPIPGCQIGDFQFVGAELQPLLFCPLRNTNQILVQGGFDVFQRCIECPDGDYICKRCQKLDAK
jgi:hypothetical protein